MKKNYNDRMETLNNAGIDTSKFFNVAISKDTPKGTTFTITIDDDGKPTVSMEQIKQIFNKIENEGYVKSNSLFRRWVMAQTFRMLNHPKGWTEALKQKPYRYQWTMLENELHAMSKLEKEDSDTFEKRKCFFTKRVILDMLNDYKVKAKEYPRYHYSNNYEYMRLVDVERATAVAMTAIVKAENYKEMYYAIVAFNRDVRVDYPSIKVRNEAPHSKEWIDAFKGAGAYYTLQNMMMYSLGEKFWIPYGNNEKRIVNRSTGLIFLEVKKNECAGEWWKLFGWMKEVIKLNNFSFKKLMKEKYGYYHE